MCLLNKCSMYYHHYANISFSVFHFISSSEEACERKKKKKAKKLCKSCHSRYPSYLELCKSWLFRYPSYLELCKSGHCRYPSYLELCKAWHFRYPSYLELCKSWHCRYPSYLELCVIAMSPCDMRNKEYKVIEHIKIDPCSKKKILLKITTSKNWFENA